MLSPITTMEVVGAGAFASGLCGLGARKDSD